MDDLVSLAASLAYVDEVQTRFERDPTAVDVAWRKLFEGTAAEAAPTPSLEISLLAKVWALVNAFRARGHLEAQIDPLGLLHRAPHPELDPEAYGFSAADMERLVPAGALALTGELSLGELIGRLRRTYCRTIGVEFRHISSPERTRWLTERMEPTLNEPALDPETQRAILWRLAAAETFEHFCHAKYIGTKRFSLEGAEALLPLLDFVLEHAARLGAKEAVIGMAHRGRLNILTNLLGKPPNAVFAEFEDVDPESVLGSGDVKYHLGYSSDVTTRLGQKLHLSLAFNPSHLEAVDPVVIGRVRAKQERRGDYRRVEVFGILVHGDAAFAGQGLVAETLNLSAIPGYRVGGTVHVVVNNQIGFTTAPREARSTPYPTDIAKMLQCPIFHVNGDDPEAVAHVAKLAMEYRSAWKSDVVIDLTCYRKYGHNESDEPSFTQPLLYQRIADKTTPLSLYGQALIQRGVVSRAELDAVVSELATRLAQELKVARNGGKRLQASALAGIWSGYVGGAETSVPDVGTHVSRERLLEVAVRANTVPTGLQLHPKVARLYQRRIAMGRGERPIDWGMAEILAYGSLLWEGVLVRLTGQDTVRGTFSHRHAAVFDLKTGESFVPLGHLHPNQGACCIHDSPLSEAGVVGFELGFALDSPDGLVIWEAQFGDFVNGAQVILDQFISSSEDKWSRLSGLTLLLPHGYEGQGPEHSSARYERLLQLAAEDNFQICQPTTPAQMFHLLRRQAVRKWRKPLFVLTPKSLLRHPACTSPIQDFVTGRFQCVWPDSEPPPSHEVRRVILCSGKVGYELAEKRREQGDRVTAILRLEQLYPWRPAEIAGALAGYERATELVWVQEEPANMGAAAFVGPRLAKLVPNLRHRVVARPESASPATGSAKAHAIGQRRIMSESFE